MNDIVLHDGAANGYRKFNNQDFPVFDVLQLMKKSGYKTIAIKVKISNDKDLDILKELLSKINSKFEDWTSTVRTICKQCSEGKPHEQHDHDLKNNQWQPERFLGIATKQPELLNDKLHQWQNKTISEVLDFGGL